MRHGRRKKKLGVKTGHRKALLRNLVRALVIHKRIRTTVTRAKATSAVADRMVQIAKRGDLQARRLLISHLGDPETADRLIKRIAPHFKSRQGGYTRVMRLDEFRPGDAGDVALLEFTEQIDEPAKTKKKAAKKTKSPAIEETKVEKKSKAAKEEKASDSEGSPKKKGEEPSETKKETEKKGGFLGTLRKFLKGDDNS